MDTSEGVTSSDEKTGDSEADVLTWLLGQLLDNYVPQTHPNVRQVSQTFSCGDRYLFTGYPAEIFSFSFDLTNYMLSLVPISLHKITYFPLPLQKLFTIFKP